MLKKLFFICIFISILYLGHTPSYAIDFSIDQNMTIDCSIEETCKVLNNISITNNTNEMFVSEYTLNTGFKNIDKVNAKDSKKNAFLTKIEQVNDQNSIIIKFEKPILGKDSVTNLTVSYETKEIVKKTGKIWEISIPKINETEENNNININVSVPKIFGPLMYATPKPTNQKETNEEISYSFNNNTPINGINMAFGDYQLFNFEIYYYLKNPDKILSKDFEVPFPPNITDIQKVFITNINEKPINLIVDENGNYIATYTLKAEETKRIEIYGLIQVFNKELNIEKGGKFEDIPKKMVEEYTKSQKYWEIENKQITDIANSLTNRNENVSENAKKVYDFVTTTLKYSVERTKRNYLERYGAYKALQNPNDAVCMEFTDLTIALLRAMKIPAREINGYAHSEDLSKRPLSVFYDNNKDLLHSWVEFYDPNFGWVEIDPTWGQTSGLDFFSKVGVNHIVFVRKENPNYPLPPGVYKDELGNKKSVVITFGNEDLLKENPKPIESFLNKKGNFDLSALIIVTLLAMPALYMIYLVLRGLLEDPRR
ncbi:MAG: transglutaminase-like domain-containing protein [bacterium]